MELAKYPDVLFAELGLALPGSHGAGWLESLESFLRIEKDKASKDTPARNTDDLYALAVKGHEARHLIFPCVYSIGDISG